MRAPCMLPAPHDTTQVFIRATSTDGLEAEIEIPGVAGCAHVRLRVAFDLAGEADVLEVSVADDSYREWRTPTAEERRATDDDVDVASVLAVAGPDAISRTARAFPFVVCAWDDEEGTWRADSRHGDLAHAIADHAQLVRARGASNVGIFCDGIEIRPVITAAMAAQLGG